MKVATEKKKQGLPYAMIFTHLFSVYDVEVTGEVREKPKETKKIQQGNLEADGKVDLEVEKDDEEGDDGAVDNEGTPIGDRSHMSDRTLVLRPHKILITASSRKIWASSAHERRLVHLEASIADLKAKQQKLSKSVEYLATSVKIGFVDVKKILTNHTERFGIVDKDVKSLQNQVSNSIIVAAYVIQGTTDEFKATSAKLQTFVKKSHEDITQVTEVYMNSDKLLRPHVMKWTY
ncbi:hypothetical protein CJ030_MR0G005037 [Morella rubra]|uniref:Uncharacterized protein n=1 Tax=Morella rubra TaxID=262757 RepID=A0A6A1UKU9_9ROSI|nr:hypothetical protein CJ030_MR0G005037 [Morella rubra]